MGCSNSREFEIEDATLNPKMLEEDALALQQGLRGRIDNLTGHGGRPGGPDRG